MALFPNNVLIRCLILLIPLFCLPALYAESSKWKYYGEKTLSFLPDTPQVIGGGATIGDDHLDIYYSKKDSQWYILFTYNSTNKFSHSESFKPEFFVRTEEKLNTEPGKHSSDYAINNKAHTYSNGADQPQYLLMPLKEEDLDALKKWYAIGAGYWIATERMQMVQGGKGIMLPKSKTYRFYPVSSTGVIQKIEDAVATLK